MPQYRVLHAQILKSPKPRNKCRKCLTEIHYNRLPVHIHTEEMMLPYEGFQWMLTPISKEKYGRILKSVLFDQVHQKGLEPVVYDGAYDVILKDAEKEFRATVVCVEKKILPITVQGARDIPKEMAEKAKEKVLDDVNQEMPKYVGVDSPEEQKRGIV